jgi:uncharacterized membrane-anchored protein YhcB (DUF1043 family)
VITTAPKDKTKPSLRTQFVLEAMESEAKKEEICWEKMQERVDSLFSKMEVQDESQHQMSAQLNITTQALTQFSKDHVALMQHMVATNDLVTRLVVGQQREATPGTMGAQGTDATGHRQPEPPPHQCANGPFFR